MDPHTPPVLSVPEDAIIDMVTAVSPSPTCATDAEHAIEDKFAINSTAATAIVEHLIQQRAVEARTAPRKEGALPAAGESQEPSAVSYQFVRTGEKQSNE